MSYTITTERDTQNRVIAMMQSELGYRYIGNLQYRDDNTNIRETDLRQYLAKQGHSQVVIDKAIVTLGKSVAMSANSDLYTVNKQVYSLLRYGLNIKEEISQNNQTVSLIDWDNWSNNDFAIAEEVTIKNTQASGRKGYDKRPDIVLYINGIAIGVLELKRSSVSVSEGIRQNISNQDDIFIKPFFATIQLVMAGNDHQGIRYASIETSEKYFLNWKEVSPELNPTDEHLLEITADIRAKTAKHGYQLDKNVIEMLNKERLIEILHDFVVFDSGQKKLCRPNQYFGVKAVEQFVKDKKGGILWHTQGSGKSLSMVWITRWIKENNPTARVLIITDRSELDDQIEKVFQGVNENITRTRSGKELIQLLNATYPRLICSLVHKFGNKTNDNAKDDANDYLSDLKNNLPKDFKPKGDWYVLVDECHRTQSGELNKAMKELLGDKAIFIGFTGTPLLKSDKAKSIEIFGDYIHTYKFNEAVKDGVVLDLRYEARDIQQSISSPTKIDNWFDSKTKGLNDFAKVQLKQKWGTLHNVFSSKSRLSKIVQDIILDMGTKERLANGRGNAMLVSDGIYNACRYYELFQQAGFKECAIITSFKPNISDIKGEGDTNTQKKQQYDIYQIMLGGQDPDKFEASVKKQFINEPSKMKLLIVVDKLLTGFDAPTATYLYIDKNMRDHGLFQAICRVNRLDGEDKDYGYIVDYKDLFGNLEKSYNDFTSEAFEDYDQADIVGLLSDRITKGKERLDDTIENIKILFESVLQPKTNLEYIEYFCGQSSLSNDLTTTEPRRITLYKLTTALVRAYANIADELISAGYSQEQAIDILGFVRFCESIRKQIQFASGDYIDLKQYESSMRFLIDSYISSSDSQKITQFDDISLVQLFAGNPQLAIDTLPPNIQDSHQATAQTIENNIRRVIVEQQPTNPIYYQQMSLLLDDIIRRRSNGANDFERYLSEIRDLATQVNQPESSNRYPSQLNTNGKRALYDNLSQNLDLAIALDLAIITDKHADWEGSVVKERKLKNEIIKTILVQYDMSEQLDNIFEIIKNHQEYL